MIARWTAWLTTVCSSAVIAQADASATSATSWPVSELSAMAALIGALFYLLRVHLPSKDKMFTEALRALTAQHDKWEEIRHQDSEKLAQALNALRDNCIATQSRRRIDQDE